MFMTKLIYILTTPASHLGFSILKKNTTVLLLIARKITVLRVLFSLNYLYFFLH